MTPTQFLEVIVSVSLQATLVVAAAHWSGRLTENERTRCRLWTLCYMLLLVLVVNAAVMPHVRLLLPMRPLTRPLAAEIVAIELQLGRILFWAWFVGGVASLGLLIYRSIQAEKFLRTCRAVDPDVVSLGTVIGDSSNDRTLQIVELNRFAWTESFGVGWLCGLICGLFVTACQVVRACQVVLNLQVVRAGAIVRAGTIVRACQVVLNLQVVRAGAIIRAGTIIRACQVALIDEVVHAVMLC
jgi:hypothetical protein